MSDGESTTPAPRKRPVYGLPGPTAPDAGSAPGPGSAAGTSSPAAPSSSSPFGSSHSPAFGAGTSSGADAYTPVTGPLPPQPPASAVPHRRRGLWPLIIGLALLLIIAPAATIGGLVWSFSSLVGDTASGPAVIEGGSGQYEVAANEMLILYVPTEDAAKAQCTAEGESSGSVSTVPTTGSVTFGDGSQYDQVLGVAVLEDTTVTISCTGTDAPAYLGPYSLFKVAAPMLIGPIIGVLSGLLGLVLTVVGILLLVRSRRA